MVLGNGGFGHYATVPVGEVRLAWVGLYPFMVSPGSIRYQRSRGQTSSSSGPPCVSAPAQCLGDELGDLRRIPRCPDACLPERLALGLCRALTARDDRARMSHRLALRGREARDIGYDGDAHLAADVLGRELFSIAPDLTDHHGAFCLGVGLELAQDFDEVRPYDGVAADPDGGALSDLPLRELVDDLVGQRAAAAYDADVARHEDVLGHYGDICFPWREDAGTVRPDEGGVLGPQVVCDPHHVVDGDAFSNAADGRESGVQRLEDGVGGEGWGDEDHARVRARLFDGLLDGVEDRDSFVLLPALTRRHPSDHPGAALQHSSRVERALPARYALNEEPRPFVYEYRHDVIFPRL